ncbi:MAG TPA: hypothetical protein VFV99_26960 [Kofleriaceae bacterium]|nr:hypothetical protein [Kofleriaceae bacterium]
MTRAIVFASLLAATAAGAQPITRPTACGVTIAYASADVRIVVDAFVAQETTCNATLEVRIVPTDGGLYLFARDERGRVRERVVPDAQAAAVLVASWMADDTRPPVPPPIAVFDHHVPPATVTVDPFDRVPSAEHESHGWLFGLGPTLAGAGAGVRAEIDVASWGAWSIGVAASLVDNEATLYITQQADQSMDVIDSTGLVYVTRRTDLGDWYLRPALGVGFTYTQMTTRMDYSYDPFQPWPPGIEYQADGTVATVDAQLLLGRRLGDHWQLDAGPGVTVFADGPGLLQRSPQRSLFAALRYRL